MADNDSYSAFLDKANQDTGASKSRAEEAKGQGVSTLVNTDADLPKQIRDVHGREVMYVSESDEPFEGVSLRMDGHDLEALVKKQSGGGEVESMSAKEFDPKDRYEEVIAAVKKAAGEVKVFRVEGKGSRVEYWILGHDEKEGRAVGFRARAVES